MLNSFHFLPLKGALHNSDAMTRLVTFPHIIINNFLFEKNKFDSITQQEVGNIIVGANSTGMK